MITEEEKKICIVAFSDIESNSLAYKKFDDIDKAIEFYRIQLEKDDVNVISTRKTILNKQNPSEVEVWVKMIEIKKVSKNEIMEKITLMDNLLFKTFLVNAFEKIEVKASDICAITLKNGWVQFNVNLKFLAKKKDYAKMLGLRLSKQKSKGAGKIWKNLILAVEMI